MWFLVKVLWCNGYNCLQIPMTFLLFLDRSPLSCLTKKLASIIFTGSSQPLPLGSFPPHHSPELTPDYLEGMQTSLGIVMKGGFFWSWRFFCKCHSNEELTIFFPSSVYMSFAGTRYWGQGKVDLTASPLLRISKPFSSKESRRWISIWAH